MSELYLVMLARQRAVHYACDTMTLYPTRHRSSYSTSYLWPPNSFNLNQVDYSVWAITQERVDCTPIVDVADLKRRMIAAWLGLQQHVIDEAIDQWSRQLYACVRANF